MKTSKGLSTCGGNSTCDRSTPESLFSLATAPGRRRRRTRGQSPHVLTVGADERRLMMPGVGAWARVSAVGAVAGTALAVVSGAAGWGTAHRLLAALALPWLVALLVVAWLTTRRLLPPAAVALGSFGIAAFVTSNVPHVAAASIALTATATTCAAAFRR